MRIPDITPVLTGQTIPTVRAVVHDIVRRMGDEGAHWRTALWLAAKGLQWLHFNSPAFIAAGGAGEGAQRHLFRRVWSAAGAALSPDRVAELHRFFDATTAQDRCSDEYSKVFARAPKVPSADVVTHMARTMDLFSHAMTDTSMGGEQRRVWATLILSATFDIIVANPRVFAAFGASFATTAYRKWLEVGEEWPFFMQAYPVTVLPARPAPCEGIPQ